MKANGSEIQADQRRCELIELLNLQQHYLLKSGKKSKGGRPQGSMNKKRGRRKMRSIEVQLCSNAIALQNIHPEMAVGSFVQWFLSRDIIAH